ncbi:MAG TPA: hypothetical protein P5567_10100 [Kiritimatiellia bacterium]|nr:hypothetical protein [Kiritimatiellia bacterium]HRZ12792.1 hypothetical protein [Kiritimatiellia bacterium]HSA18256.1 hypothetical protein [Kiritimatiellia bacterium]
MKIAAVRFIKALVALLVALLLLHTSLLILSGLSLRNAYKELRQAGRPIGAADIIPPPVPAGENAAPLYTSAFALLDAKTIGEEPLFSRLAQAARDFSGEPESEEKQAALEQLLGLEDVARALEMIEQASARPKCNFNLQYDQGAALLFPHVNGMLKISRILAARTKLEARRREGDRAWSAVETNLRMADALRDEPALISALVRIAIFQAALTSAREAADLAAPDDQTAARLMARLATADDPAPYVLAMDGERILMGEWAFNHVRTQKFFDCLGMEGEACNWKMQLYNLLIGYRPARQADQATYLRAMGEVAQRAARPYWESPVEPDREWDRAMPWYGAISRLILPALGQSRIRAATLQAEVRITRAGLAMIRYKTAQGRYPATLDELVPAFLDEIPRDPFTGEPLVYRPEGDGFVLYSLGQNQQDDGGTAESPDNRDTKTFDIVWRRAR